MYFDHFYLNNSNSVRNQTNMGHNYRPYPMGTSLYNQAEMPENDTPVMPELPPDENYDELPESPEMPPFAPPGELPESPETPPFAPPGELPESPETPPFAPPGESPELPPFEPPEMMPPFNPPAANPPLYPPAANPPLYPPAANPPLYPPAANPPINPPAANPPYYPPPVMPPQLPEIPIITPPIIVPILPYAPENAINGYCNIRFLYAATGQVPVNISINKRSVVNSLRFGNLTTYTTEAAGLVTITLRNANAQRVIMNQTSFILDGGKIYTIAIVNSPTGIGLYLIEDTSCNRIVYDSCIRVVNLSDNAPPLDIFLSDGRVLYKDVRFKDITPYRAISPGSYTVMAAETSRCNVPTYRLNDVIQVIPIVIGGGVNTCYNNILLTSRIVVEADRIYTLYIIGNPYSFPFLQFVYAESYLEP